MASKYFLYARKSTDSEERQILSIEAQLAELRALAKKERLFIVGEFIEAMTAKEPGRPIFNQLMSRIEKGEANGILSWHPDRLARNSVDGGRVVYFLDTSQIQSLKFPTFWFENTPQGKFMLNIAFGQSKYMVDSLSENVKRGLRHKLRRGEWPGFAPPGYLNDKVLRKVVMDPVKGPLIRRLIETYAAGHVSLRELKEQSFQWGLVGRQGKQLVKMELVRTLTNPFYYGVMRYTGEVHQGTHEPLITKATFDEVQEVLRRRGRRHTSKRHLFPFLGLAKCKSCGGAITAELQKGHHYYRCSKKRGKCPEPYIREELLASQIQAAIERVALPDKTFQKLIAVLAQETETSTQPVAALRAKTFQTISAIQAKLDRLLDAQLDGLVEKSEYLSKKEALLNQKVELAEKLAHFEQRATGWVEPARTFFIQAHSAEKIATGGDLESQKKFLVSLGSNFQLAAKSLRFDYEKPWDALAKNGKNRNWRRGGDSNPRYGF